MSLEIPEANDDVQCPLCGEREGHVVGEQGRFGMPVRNLCCRVCATVYVTPRPTPEAMAEYYKSTYRKHYGGVGYLTPEGTKVGPEDAEFEACKTRWHAVQAENAIAVCKTQPGARVLEVGCRHAKTLRIMRDRLSIEAFGVEPGEAEALEARQHGVDCFTGIIEDYQPGEERFDQVQMFHVLEHLHEPLAALIRLRSLLKPGGALLLEVPNVYQPYGPLQSNFFQNVHLVSYSPNTLPALMRRAGFGVTAVVDGGALLCVGRRVETQLQLPLPFRAELLPSPEQDAQWVALRLRSYENLYGLTEMFMNNGYSPELFSLLLRALAWPAFVDQLLDTCAVWVEGLSQAGLAPEALQVLEAVIAGPHPKDVKQELELFATRMRGDPLDDEELVEGEGANPDAPGVTAAE